MRCKSRRYRSCDSALSQVWDRWGGACIELLEPGVGGGHPVEEPRGDTLRVGRGAHMSHSKDRECVDKELDVSRNLGRKGWDGRKQPKTAQTPEGSSGPGASGSPPAGSAEADGLSGNVGIWGGGVQVTSKVPPGIRNLRQRESREVGAQGACHAGC